MATSTDSSVRGEQEMSEGSAAVPDPVNQVMTTFDLNLTVEENLLFRVSWYKDKYDEALKDNAALRKELAEANQLLKRGYGDDRQSQKRVRDDETTSYGDQAQRKNKFAPFSGRWSAPPPSYHQHRRQYSPGRQSKYCKICRMRNHSIEECRVRTGACFCCGKIGHKMYECPKFKDFKKPWHQVPRIDNVPKKDDGSPSQKTKEKL